MPRPPAKGAKRCGARREDTNYKRPPDFRAECRGQGLKGALIHNRVRADALRELQAPHRNFDKKH